MLRRVFVDQPLTIGHVHVDAQTSHYVRTVLRLPIGEEVELFDAAGGIASAYIYSLAPNVDFMVESIRRAEPAIKIVIASAIPKGDRADWMIEKLSEIGVTRFVPLATQRSVVLPGGESKFERWRRIAAESARQSRRVGVMSIDPLTELSDWLDANANCIFLSTTDDVTPLLKLINSLPTVPALLIGPEGGWSESELIDFADRGLTGAKLGPTILRVETAAVAAAVIAATAGL